MLGINGAEFVVLIIVALLVVGPERLPAYAEQLASWVRSLRRFASTARERVAEELGEEAADVDWASLDPRRYDPRRIVRDALLEDVSAPSRSPAGSAARTGAGGAAAAAGAAAAGGAATGRGAPPAEGRAAGPTGGPADGPRYEVLPEGAQAPFDDEAT